MKRLWRVTIAMELVIFTESELDAAEIAEDAAKQAARERQYTIDHIAPIDTVKEVPDGWLGALPWTDEEEDTERTVGEILSAVPAPFPEKLPPGGKP